MTSYLRVRSPVCPGPPEKNREFIGNDVTHLSVSPLHQPGLNGPKSTAHEYLRLLCPLCPANEFAHNQLTIRPDGSVHTIDHRTSKEKVYSLEELSRLFNRVHSLIHDRLVSVLEIQVECWLRVLFRNFLSLAFQGESDSDFSAFPSSIVTTPLRLAPINSMKLNAS